MHSDQKGNLSRKRYFTCMIMLVISLILGAFLFNPLRSLISLQKLDDYPLFIMHYYEDNITEQWVQSALGESFLEHHKISVMRSNSSSAFATAHLEGYSILGRNQEFWRSDQPPILMLIMHPTDGYKSISMVSLDFLDSNDNKLVLMDALKILMTPYLIQDGMNEYGLGVSITAVPCRIGSPSKNTPTINSSLAMRIILNQAKSVDEALEILEGFNIHFRDICGHHLLADAYGNMAVVEYIDGEMIVNRNQNPWQVATNFLMNEYQPVEAEGPCWRYRKVAESLGNQRGKISTKYAMEILESVSAKPIWSVVYNLTTGGIELSLGSNFELLYTLSLDMQFEPKPWFEIQQANLLQK